jgi:ribosomal protein L40E
MTKLVCPECGHENEPERIYCHRCGARLDRSATASRTSQQKELKDTQRHVRKMLKPQNVASRRLFFTISKVVLGACAAAAVIQMILPPDVPSASKDVAPRQINFDLENAIYSHRPAQLEYTEEQVNAYLAYTLKSKQSALNKRLLNFKRAIVGFGEGAVTITAERSLFGYSLYSGSAYAVRAGEGKIVVSNKGGNIGRLPFHPGIMQFMDIIFADLWSALQREQKLIAKMGAIEFHEKQVLLSAPAAIGATGRPTLSPREPAGQHQPQESTTGIRN